MQVISIYTSEDESQPLGTCGECSDVGSSKREERFTTQFYMDVVKKNTDLLARDVRQALIPDINSQNLPDSTHVVTHTCYINNNKTLPPPCMFALYSWEVRIYTYST